MIFSLLLGNWIQKVKRSNPEMAHSLHYGVSGRLTTGNFFSAVAVKDKKTGDPVKIRIQ